MVVLPTRARGAGCGLGLLGLVLAAPALARVVPKHATLVDRATASSTTYDFVIAGGGIAGLTVADRLTEDPSVTVLVVEAGPLDRGEDAVRVPGAYNPGAYLWPNLFSVPQAGLNNGVYFAATARVVGGGSTVNAMIFLRGDKDDYAGWTALGNRGWAWDDLLPYFCKSENFTFPAAAFAAQNNISWTAHVHGTAGPVQATYPNYRFPGSGHWYEAAVHAGIAPDTDPNDGSVRGVFWLPLAEDATTRTRSDARANHYDRVAAARPNYHLLPGTTVSKVLFSAGKKATGVQLVATDASSTAPTTATVAASKEVLLAAGGLHTPQLLQLSGIGPQALLAQFGIPVVADLPGVGQNFQDQPTIPMTYNFTNNVSPNWGSLLNNATYDAAQYARYESSKTGPYTLVRTLSTNFAALALQDITPDYQAIVAAARARNATAALPTGTDPTVAAGYVAQRAVLLQQLAGEAAVGGLHWNTDTASTLYAFKPLSRGTVAIASADVRDAPRIDYRTATDPTDLAVYAALLRKNRQLMAAPAMAALGPVETAPFGPGATSDAAVAAALVAALNPTNGHACCTAAMLPRRLGGVVDADLCVYGVTGLRVLDISFWPFPVAGAPSATMYAAGEKMAAVIKAKYGLW
ncbi:choline dehydrogenase [Sporothrix schenckii 1099-18]|uniref:Choline dehydrogenase n=1 Tax=Sporothrix schenckii 1099-18 TaxID=1397361 RepID=A0A0F2LX31_SPOSC|nr:choline dehydrogenase [Sporothrix schenckii 1099-18]KJR82012.1 choline dehydrogenase [Sporothrix schenckii 1099-18]